MRFAAGFTSGNLTVQANNVCGVSGTTATYALGSPTGNPAVPATPIATGADPNNICTIMGTSSTVNFSVPAVTNAGSYTWTLPAAATVINGANTNSIDVTFAGNYDGKGTVSVKSVNACGTFTSAASKTLAVKWALPAAPKSVLGTVTNPGPIVGKTTKAQYSCSAVAGVSVFHWTVPVGVTIDTAGAYVNGNDTINVTYTNAFALKGSISVQSSEGCGLSKATSLAIAEKAPASAPAPVGPLAVCMYVNTTNNPTYTTRKVAGATYYLWTVPANANIVGLNGDTAIVIHFSTGFAGGDITVAAVDGFGGAGQIASGVKKLTLKAPIIPATPIEIDGETGVCQLLGSTATYATPPIPNATSYIWTVPAPATIVGNANGSSIVVSYPSTGFTGGNITVAAFEGCGASKAVATLAVSPKPSKPVISGFALICGTTTTTYTVANHAGSTYNWSFLKTVSGAVINNGTTNAASIQWGSSTGTLLVTETGCGATSDVASMVIKKGACKLINGQLVVDAEQAPLELSVYPNPSQGNNVNLLLTGVQDQDGAKASILMYDLLGKIVYSNQTVYNAVAGATDVINTDAIKPGMYFVTVQVGNDVYQQKVVISH